MRMQSGVTDELFKRINRTRANNVFAQGSQAGPTAGENSIIEFLNPAGSGVDCAIFSILIAQAAAGEVEIIDQSAGLATAAVNGISLLDGSTAGSAEIRGDTPAGFPGGNVWLFTRVPADTPLEFAQDFPFVLTPNNGMYVLPVAQNVELAVTWYWVELSRT